MGYSKSKRAIKKVEPYLQQMVAADGNIEFPVDDASKFAFDLRQATKTSRLYAFDALKHEVEPYASYARLLSKFIVRTRGNVVVCELRDFVPVARLRESMNVMSIPEVSETLGIIGAAIKHKASELVFPDASEETIDPLPIYNWAKNNGYFLVVADSHVTLTRNDPEELAWRP